MLLAEDHFITMEEFEEEESEYATYKELHGNHTGDALHKAVCEKYYSQIAKQQ